MTDGDKARGLSRILHATAKLRFTDSKLGRSPQPQLPQQDGQLAEGGPKDVSQGYLQGDIVHAHVEPGTIADLNPSQAGEPGAGATNPYAGPTAPPGGHVSTVVDLHRAKDGGQNQGVTSTLSQEVGNLYTRASQSSRHPDICTIDNVHEAALKEKDHHIAALQCENEALHKSAARWEHRFQTTRSELDAALSHNSHQKQEIEEAHRRLFQGEKEVEKLRTLLRDRTEEVKVAQAFTTTADKHSIAEVCQMVEQLNDEIYQCAMGFSDAVRELPTVADRTQGQDWKDRVNGARHNLRRWDKDVITRLESELKNDDPVTTLLESIVQYLLTGRCFTIIHDFCPRDNVTEEFMQNLWEGVAATHKTSVARNWQAITRGSLKPLVKPFGRKRLLLQLGSIITLCSRELDTPTVLEEFMTSKLNQIDAKVLKVKEAAAEGILSADVEVLMQGRELDFNPLEMRDAFESPNRPRPSAEANGKGGVVLCGTGLGVCRITRERNQSGSSGAHKKTEVILKPTVLLYSTLIE